MTRSSDTRRRLLMGAATLLGAPAVQPLHAQNRKLRFGVGPFLPSGEDTKKAYTPLFAHLARQLNADFELQVTSDWAGLAVAMASGNLDVAWMGPWGYVIANNLSNCQAVATVKYDDKPTYRAIIIARPDLKVNRFPDDTRGMSISFADLGSTSGWLIPSWYAKEIWKIDPKAFWKYSEGASHPANEVAVSSGQMDLATDYDRNRNAMIAAGRIKEESNKVVWQSAPLPNDAIALPPNAPGERVQQVQQALLAIDSDLAKTLLPNRYTGFIAATHASYADIEKAGLALGKIKPRA